jgi:hypothetical protein
MPAVQQRSDAADRRSLGECRNRRMGQLMSNAISYASTGPGFPVAQVCAEVCLDPVSAAHDGKRFVVLMPAESPEPRETQSHL